MIPQNNIFGTAKYLRIVADMGYKKWKAGELSVFDESFAETEIYGFAGYIGRPLDLSELDSDVWIHPATIILMGSEYTSEMWDAKLLLSGSGHFEWGLFVLLAYEDIVRGQVFSSGVTLSYLLHPPDVLLKGLGMP